MTARIILLTVALLIVIGCGRGAADPATNYPVGTRFVVEVSGRAIEVEVIAVVMRDGTTWHVVADTASPLLVPVLVTEAGIARGISRDALAWPMAVP